MTIPALADAFEADRGRLLDDTFLRACAEATNTSPDEAKRRIVAYLSEVATGARLLSGLDLRGKRILEVGAGLGLLSLALKREGHDVVALEPGAGGFAFSAVAGRLARSMLGFEDLPVLDIVAQQLDRERHGAFDVIFSVNVLEHIPELDAAMGGMLNVLGEAGVMVHTCPNYTVPYEPHYGLPLVPFAPRMTAMFAPRIRHEELWQSLNFVTAGQIASVCRRHGCDVAFRRGLVHDAFARLRADADFRARQPAFLRGGLRLLEATGLLAATKALPPALATPMTFTVRRRNEREPELRVV